MRHCAILGAGFSRCAGLPTQKQFQDFLLSDDLARKSIHRTISLIIKSFMMDAFGWREQTPMPSLEDFFTCIDLSANSGHHLGTTYPPQKLRAIRRMTIHRIFQILDYRFKYSDDIAAFLASLLEIDSPSFIVTNWDIVLERGLQSQGAGSRICYGFDSIDWQTKHPRAPNSNDIVISKLHGSSNWAYCDNCSVIYYDLDEKLALHKMIGLLKSDFALFSETFANKYFDEDLGIDPDSRTCPICGNMLSTHIATFSFRKSYRTFAYPWIWHNAQAALMESSRWVFVGYSLPDADFEFKHLLKTAELTFLRRRLAHSGFLDIVVVLKDDPSAEARYRAFFGDRIRRVIQGGLEEYVKLNRIGVGV